MVFASESDSETTTTPKKEWYDDENSDKSEVTATEKDDPIYNEDGTKIKKKKKRP